MKTILIRGLIVILALALWLVWLAVRNHCHPKPTTFAVYGGAYREATWAM
jgi:hypothetical protein